MMRFALELRKHYAACVSYADAQVGTILAELKKLGLEEDTIVVLWGDHGWHLGEHAIWGKHALFEESLRSPLIIKFPGLGKPGAKTDAMVETLDIFPTLCDLAGVPVPGFIQGESLRAPLEDPNAAGHAAVAYKGGARTLRTDRWRLVKHNDGFVELYDHSSPEQETRNVAGKHPTVVEKLTAQLAARRKI